MSFLTTTPVLASLLELVRPSKSPHLIASIIGILSLALICTIRVSDTQFWFVSIPIYLTMVVVVLFSFRDVPDEDDTDVENHFRFARAMGIGTGILGMALAGFLFEYPEKEVVFFVAYAIALLQLSTFVFYSALRLFKKEKEVRIKIVEISFIMFIHLLGFTYCMSNVSIDAEGDFIGQSLRYALSSVVLGVLWLIYEIFWIRRIFRIIEIRVH